MPLMLALLYQLMKPVVELPKDKWALPTQVRMPWATQFGGEHTPLHSAGLR